MSTVATSAEGETSLPDAMVLKYVAPNNVLTIGRPLVCACALGAVVGIPNPARDLLFDPAMAQTATANLEIVTPLKHSHTANALRCYIASSFALY